jgi:hypothetical protein
VIAAIQDMEKLEILLQEMVVRKFGKRRWNSIIQASLPLCDFEQHIESYGPQRVAAREFFSPAPGCGQILSAGSTLMGSAADLLGTTVPDLIEELGGYFARSLQNKVSPRRPFASEADYFSAAAFYYNSCSWILDAIVPGSLRVRSTHDAGLEIQCVLREADLRPFLKGFLSEIQGGQDGPATVTHAEATSHSGEAIESFVIRNGATLDPERRTGNLALVG